jgi:hypothetical protein
MSEKSKFELPTEVTKPTGKAPRDLVIISQPKMGKGSIFGSFTESYNGLILDLEKGGYDYIAARKLSTYVDQSTTRWESFQNYTAYRKMLLENKGKYDYLLIDGLSDLDDLSEIGGTLAYMNSITGKKFNRVGGVETGKKLAVDDPEFRSVITLPDGAGL